MERIISIIVPIYNVEKYLEKCINSLLLQDIDVEYEIVLVDDGSTDKSGLICDKYDAIHDNIRVIHKKNGGLSDARNVGVMNSSGKYITFVDSDDYVSADYLRVLYKPMVMKNADVSSALHLSVSESDPCDYTQPVSSSEKVEVFKNGRDILEFALIGKKGSLNAWCKMYSRELITKHLFPVGKLYEDMLNIYEIYNESHIVAFTPARIYYYLQRKNSIVRSRITIAHLYGIDSCIQIYNTEKREYNQFTDQAQTRIIMQACGHLPNLCQNNDKQMFSIIYKRIKPYYKKVLFKRGSIKNKLRCIAYVMPPCVGLKYAKLLFGAKEQMRQLRKG